MDDLISRAAAIGCLGNSPEQMCMPWSEVERILRELPAVAAEPVVRCRDCKYYDRRCFTCENDVLLIKIDDCGCHPPFRVDDDWFCADGERRDT